MKRKQWAVCVKNDGYEASLEKLKVYRFLPGKKASAYKSLRVVDESGRSYFYPKKFFVPIKLPPALQRILK